MRRRYVYDREMDEMVEVGAGSNYPREQPSGVQIIRDIEPYRTAASDVASDGKRAIIGSRSRHRAFLRDNHYVEVGNEKPMSGPMPTMSREERIADIRRAMGDFGSRVRD